MPFSYQCQNPSCKQIFESINSMGVCMACHMGRLKPYFPEEGAADIFPAPGKALDAEVVRFDNTGSTATNKYKITDGTDRSLKIETWMGAAATTVTVDAANVTQLGAGELESWIILNPSKQPDWGHLGTTALQNAIKQLNRTAPPQAPVYVRLGFQHGTNVHVGFGFVHILFSHKRKKYTAIAEDIANLMEAVELRKYYTCAQHQAVHLNQEQHAKQNGKCVARFRGAVCGKPLVEKNNPKGIARLFKSSQGGGGRYALTTEKGGEVVLGIFELRDATFNLITMYTTTASALRHKMDTGEFTLLYPRNF